MVDIAIAANFARELTEDQFAQPRPVQRRHAAADHTANGADPARSASRRAERTRVGRTLARLAHVRG
jgi:hypothetical protein